MLKNHEYSENNKDLMFKVFGHQMKTNLWRSSQEKILPKTSTQIPFFVTINLENKKI